VSIWRRRMLQSQHALRHRYLFHPEDRMLKLRDHRVVSIKGQGSGKRSVCAPSLAKCTEPLAAHERLKVMPGQRDQTPASERSLPRWRHGLEAASEVGGGALCNTSAAVEHHIVAARGLAHYFERLPQHPQKHAWCMVAAALLASRPVPQAAM